MRRFRLSIRGLMVLHRGRPGIYRSFLRMVPGGGWDTWSCSVRGLSSDPPRGFLHDRCIPAPGDRSLSGCDALPFHGDQATIVRQTSAGRVSNRA
jgi:hypothetical protein